MENGVDLDKSVDNTRFNTPMLYALNINNYFIVEYLLAYKKRLVIDKYLFQVINDRVNRLSSNILLKIIKPFLKLSHCCKCKIKKASVLFSCSDIPVCKQCFKFLKRTYKPNFKTIRCPKCTLQIEKYLFL